MLSADSKDYSVGVDVSKNTNIWSKTNKAYLIRASSQNKSNGCRKNFNNDNYSKISTAAQLGEMLLSSNKPC